MTIRSISKAVYVASLILGAVVASGSVVLAQQAKRESQAVGLQSFAATQAPEAATEACYGATARAAQSCALAKCEKKAGKGACFALTLCSPGGWSGIMGVTVGEISFADVLCGAPTKDALIAGLTAYCEGHLPNMKQCSLTQVWGPDGKSATVERTWTPADFKK